MILSINELEISGVIADPSCNPSNGIGNGSIIINMIGGQAPFIYQWSSSNGSGLETNSKDQSGLTGGTYVLRVTDSNGCIKEGTFTLVHPNIISLLANTTQPTCAESKDGAIAITATGGTGGYSYAWSTIDGSGLTNNTEDQVALSGGTFIVTVTDASGCSIIDQYVLTQPEPLESEETSKTVCEIDLPYEWNGMSLAESGVYTIDVTTNSGCNRQEILNLTVITELPGEPEVITICPEELPYTHLGEEFDTPGMHATQVMGSSGCMTTLMLDLRLFEEKEDVTSQLGLCNDELPYIWNGIEINDAGLFTVQEVDENGCIYEEHLELELVSSSAIVLHEESVCPGGSFVWDVNGVEYNEEGEYAAGDLEGC